MSGELHQLSVAIGSLNAQVENLTEFVRETREESRDEHREARENIDALSESVRVLTSAVKWMEPITEDYREKRAEARGARRLLSAVYVLAGGSVAVVVSKIVEYFAAQPRL